MFSKIVFHPKQRGSSYDITALLGESCCKNSNFLSSFSISIICLFFFFFFFALFGVFWCICGCKETIMPKKLSTTGKHFCTFQTCTPHAHKHNQPNAKTRISALDTIFPLTWFLSLREELGNVDSHDVWGMLLIVRVNISFGCEYITCLLNTVTDYKSSNKISMSCLIASIQGSPCLVWTLDWRWKEKENNNKESWKEKKTLKGNKVGWEKRSY